MKEYPRRILHGCRGGRFRFCGRNRDGGAGKGGGYRNTRPSASDSLQFVCLGPNKPVTQEEITYNLAGDFKREFE